MEVILSKDFLIQYFISRGKKFTDKDTNDNIRINIVEKPDNIIVFSKNYIDLLGNELIDVESEYYDDYAVMISHLLTSTDKCNLSISQSTTSTNAEEEFEYLNKTISCDFFISISEIPLSSIPHTACISLIDSSNWHRTMAYLAAYHSISLEKFHFKTDNEIEDFFHEIFSLPIKINKVYYFDRYASHITEHKCFSSLCRKKYDMEVYSSPQK